MAFDFIFKKAAVNPDGVLGAHGLQANGQVQKYIDSEVLRLCDPMVPFDVGTLVKSGTINTQIGSGEVKYRTPYARRWYYMPANFQESPRRGNYWFERMKNEYKDQLLQGAAKIAGGKA